MRQLVSAMMMSDTGGIAGDVRCGIVDERHPVVCEYLSERGSGKLRQLCRLCQRELTVLVEFGREETPRVPLIERDPIRQIQCQLCHGSNLPTKTLRHLLLICSLQEKLHGLHKVQFGLFNRIALTGQVKLWAQGHINVALLSSIAVKRSFLILLKCLTKVG
jgi:hypothetical protein